MALAHLKYRYSDSLSSMFGTMFINLRLKKRFVPSADVRLDGKVAIVTGGNRSIGKFVSIDLAARGAKVIIACRDIETGEVTASEIRAKTPNAIVLVKKLDLASFDSIRQFAADVLASEPKIDILVNNAGYLNSKRIETADQMEVMMQINCFGPILLTSLLLERIIASGDGRIVNTSSMAHHQVSRFDLEDVNWKNKSSFPYFDVYGHAKLGLMLLTRLLGMKLAGKNVKVYAVDPGVSRTELGNNMTRFHKILLQSFFLTIFLRSVKEAGDSVISAIVDESNLYQPGVNYYMVDGRFKSGSPSSKDDQVAEKLWQIVKNVTNAPQLPN